MRTYRDGSTSKKFFCAKCNQVLDKKHVGNHDPKDITWLSATEHEDKEKKIDELQESDEHETDEEKKKEKELESLKANLRTKSSEQLDQILKDLQSEIDELTDKKKKDSRKASAKYSVLGYDSDIFNYNLVEGDRLLSDLGSVD